MKRVHVFSLKGSHEGLVFSGITANTPELFPHLRNEFIFWNVHGIMNTSGLVQETRIIHDSMNIPKIEFIAYIYILYYQSSINFQFSPNLAGFPDILN